MATIKRVIENDYEPLSSGSNTVQIQVIRGYVEIADASTLPPTSTKGHPLTINEKIVTISPPFKAWIKCSSGDNADILVSEVLP